MKGTVILSVLGRVRGFCFLQGPLLKVQGVEGKGGTIGHYRTRNDKFSC